MILIELLLLLTTIFPIYHLYTALKKDRGQKQTDLVQNSFSILVPCYNESICIKNTMEALKKLDYDKYEVIFINDGSKDNTFEVLCDELALVSSIDSQCKNFYQSSVYKKFYCINKVNTGKALSLNEGIYFSSKEIIITLDADSILNPDCLKILNCTFSDKNVAAAGGAINILQSKEIHYLKKQSLVKKLLIKLQSIDYLKGFFIYKLSLSRQNALAIISGAFGAFRKSVLIKVGGFRKSLGEDIDITIKIQKYIVDTGQKIVYLPQAGCYTECPETITDLYRQRIRWQKGFIDCVIHHSKFLLNNCTKNPLCFFLIFEAICIGIFSCMLPLFTILGLILIGNIKMAVCIFAFCKIISIIYSLFAYLIRMRYSKEKTKKFPLCIILDTVIFKPFLSFVYLTGTFAYLINKSDWKKTNRSTALAGNKGTL